MQRNTTLTVDRPARDVVRASADVSPTDDAIRTEGLVRHFAEIRAVDQVDLRIARGEIYGFLGPSGAGKSTSRKQRGRMEPWKRVRTRVQRLIRKLHCRRAGWATERDAAMVDASALDADVGAVASAETEHLQSWFAGDGERMRACVHPVLAKRTPEQPGTTSLTLHEDPTERLVADTASGEGTGFEPVQEVSVLDVFRDIATVMVRSVPLVEYLHLARFGDRSLIVNALYYVLLQPVEIHKGSASRVPRRRFSIGA